MIVLVDDERTFVQGASDERRNAAVYKNSRDAIAALWKLHFGPETVDELWLDHDLGGIDDTSDIVNGLAFHAAMGNAFPVEKIFIHTANPSAARRMNSALSYSYEVEVVDAKSYYLVSEDYWLATE